MILGGTYQRATLEPSDDDFGHVIDDPAGRLAGGVHNGGV